MAALTDAELQKLYAWIDTIPLSRPKKNINRDFSDGCLAAEVVSYYFPRLVDIHNYSASNGTQQKLYNWNTFNLKVLRRLKYQLSPPLLEDIIHCKPGAIETFLHNLQHKMAKYRASRSSSGNGSGTEGGDVTHRTTTGHDAYSEDEYSPPRQQASSSSSRGGSGSGHGGVSSSPKRSTPAASRGGMPADQQQPPASSSSSQQQQPSSQRRGSMTDVNNSGGGGGTSGAGGRSGGGGGVTNSSGGRVSNGGRRQAFDLPGPSKARRDALQREVDEEILLEKEETIQELRETVEIMEMKMAKLEQLVRLKDAKIQRLTEEMGKVGIRGGGN